jgi:hypothetical protein
MYSQFPAEAGEQSEIAGVAAKCLLSLLLAVLLTYASIRSHHRPGLLVKILEGLICHV